MIDLIRRCVALRYQFIQTRRDPHHHSGSIIAPVIDSPEISDDEVDVIASDVIPSILSGGYAAEAVRVFGKGN